MKITIRGRGGKEPTGSTLEDSGYLHSEDDSFSETDGPKKDDKTPAAASSAVAETAAEVLPADDDVPATEPPALGESGCDSSSGSEVMELPHLDRFSDEEVRKLKEDGVDLTSAAEPLSTSMINRHH